MVLGHRLHLLEFHEQQWFPEHIRELVVETLYLIWTQVPMPSMSMAQSVVCRVIEDVLRETKCVEMVDLCSGGGGPMPSVASSLRIPVTLTDLFPQAEHWERLQRSGNTRQFLRFVKEPVDATNLSVGRLRKSNVLRTFCLSLHHFQPQDVRRFLNDTISAQQPIVFVEAQERSLRFLVPFFLFAYPATWLLWVVVLTLRIVLSNGKALLDKNWWMTLALTVVVPVVPLIVWVDGLVSGIRTYSQEEFLDVAVTCTNSASYDWSVFTKIYWGFVMTFYRGTPKKSS
ncbi:transmembrane protein, putative [Bodo saltans]|uniref:Transmembrane protein, putative n=1 Tax=Bodo saltans TaxID=75058 RepID=A0A0S4JSZ2_BODSA|nr:transmembrane protein, putative [Bodo saltans]|eukprot:CUG93486.1 transmembrane protein, putative [Bodo saltans]